MHAKKEGSPSGRLRNADQAAMLSSSSMGGVIELSGIPDENRTVRMMPPDSRAASALDDWVKDSESLLNVAGLDLSQVDLSGADLTMGLLTETILRRAKLVGTDLYRSHLEHAVLDEADLTGATLVKAAMDETSLRGANLQQTDLGSTELWAVDARGACFRAAKLDGASLMAVKLQGADLADVSLSETALKVVFDEHTVVTGLSGTIFGPALLESQDTQREISGSELEQWLNSRGASVRVLNPPPSTDITYYAKISEGYSRNSPQGVVRRRTENGVTYDEAFTRNLRWEPAEYLRLCELGHNEVERVEITETEVAHFIHVVTQENT
jgi:uncharacterized protein YjbI with pentapeptide repeats